jgi:hypothetical protein
MKVYEHTLSFHVMMPLPASHRKEAEMLLRAGASNAFTSSHSVCVRVSICNTQTVPSGLYDTLNTDLLVFSALYSYSTIRHDTIST